MIIVILLNQRVVDPCVGECGATPHKRHTRTRTGRTGLYEAGRESSQYTHYNKIDYTTAFNVPCRWVFQFRASGQGADGIFELGGTNLSANDFNSISYFCVIWALTSAQVVTFVIAYEPMVCTKKAIGEFSFEIMDKPQ